MGITEEQLQSWTNSPSDTKPQLTHEQIRKALEQSSVLKNKTYEIYLQGSYANSTNIKGDSDVDIVVQLNSVFGYDDTKLTPVEKTLFNLTFPDSSSYRWINFNNDVYNALFAYFGQGNIQQGKKSIKLLGNDYRLNADIVPCLQYRKYQNFNLQNQNDFVEGIKFWTYDQTKKIINYPKLHKQNGEDKNSRLRTNENYKDLVRIVKNIKSSLVDNKGMNPKIAPSYFLECSIYNVPDGHFGGNYQASLTNILDFLLRKCDADKLITCSHQHYLFGPEPWQWNQTDAAIFLKEVEKMFLGIN